MPRTSMHAAPHRAYTLVEMLIVVTMLSILAAVLVPTLSSAGVLRIQGAIRTVISDITTAQADAIAFQQRRAVVFNFKPTSGSNMPGRYVIAEVNDAGIDTTGIYADRNINSEAFGNARFVRDAITLGSPPVTLSAPTLPVDGNNQYMIIFDEMGTPMSAPTSSTTAATTEFTLGTNDDWQAARLDQFFRIRIEALTGRVTLQNWTPRNN
jgi:prepilin-type N-terminal cleavage/methylation domain-containing protein